jgi:plastocyanin
MRYASRRALIGVRRLACILPLIASCRSGDAPAVLHLGADSVVLASGASITDVHVRASPDSIDEFQPQRVKVRPGDVLRFSSEDGGPHALVFELEGTDGAAFEFIESTDQLRSLPLTVPGASWVVSLVDAPAGRYTVRCLTHGRTFAASVSSATGR